MSDIIDGIDDLPKMVPLEKVLHGHAESLIGFMKDARLCILNGKLSPSHDNYPCISPDN